MTLSNYWIRNSASGRLSRRRFVGGAASVGLGAAAMGLVGCGGDDGKPSSTPTGGSPGAQGSASSTSTGGSPGAQGSKTAPAQNVKRGGTFKRAHNYPEGALTLDPHTQESYGSQMSIRPIYSNLIFYTEYKGPGAWELTGDLAQSWEQADKTSAVFKLKRGVKFQDLKPVNGRELTAQDVVYSYQRIKTNDPRYVMRSTYAAVTKIEAIDDYTVKFSTDEPYAPLIHNFAYPWASIVAREVVEKGDIENQPVGTGPFQLEQYSRGSYLYFKRHPNYFKGNNMPYFDRYEQPIMPDAAARLAAFRDGQLDEEWVAAAQVADLLKTNSKVIVHKNPSVGGAVIRFNCEDPVFKDKRVRQAIARATNVQDYAAVLANGEAIRHGPMARGIKTWAIDEKFLPTFNLKDAKDLLTAAGYGNGFKAETLATSVYNAVPQSEIMLAQLKKVGIDVTIESVDNAAWIARSYRASNFRFSTYGDYSYSDPDRGLRDHYHSKGGSNNHKFSDPAIDALLDKQRTIFDLPERQAVVLDIQKMLIDQSPRVWLHTALAPRAVQPWLKNYWPRVGEAGSWDQDYDQMWLDKA